MNENSKSSFYLTTSIPYVNAPPHIGFAQELLAADVLARYYRKLGKDVWFLTGTDEHGLKIVKAAQEADKTEQEFADEISAKFRNLSELLNISNDDFIRTTEPRHLKIPQELWQKAQKDIYKKKYQALYCVGCESFLTKSDLVNGKCPIHKSEPELIDEENYFFKLSNYTEKIKQLLLNNPDFIKPRSRYNEILSFVESGLEDISISRPKEKLSWGISVPGDENQIMYVWFDALSNYLSAKKYWPADLHIIGKDILRFHAALWPAMLLSVGYELPKQIYVHGFISVDGHKMSKSLGNVIAPQELVEKFGVDATRYLLLKLLNFSEDSDFSWDKAVACYNADLANDLGNLVMRVITLALKCKNQNAKIKMINQNSNRIEKIENLQFQEYLIEIWKEISAMNQEVDHKKLWKLVKDDPEKAKAELSNLFDRIYTVAEQIEPFMPESSQKIKDQLNSLTPEPLFPKVEK